MRARSPARAQQPPPKVVEGRGLTEVSDEEGDLQGDSTPLGEILRKLAQQRESRVEEGQDAHEQAQPARE